ncbi:hypothetical protein TIFTF001_016189 [Ficus carica]|uniref:Uncharacterized protein n=1 Tax=Ficus carica TaxID=3494 RepID=A0AA88AT24_FICCA|nr:hypothetical protein TIFTF001_016189 [Ficus carica]
MDPGLFPTTEQDRSRRPTAHGPRRRGLDDSRPKGLGGSRRRDSPLMSETVGFRPRMRSRILIPEEAVWTTPEQSRTATEMAEKMI